MNELGKRIDSKCKELQISTAELAKYANVNYKTLKDNMNKENPNPTIELIKKISISLGTSIDSLIFGEDKDDEIGGLARELKNIKKEDKRRILYMIRMMIAESKGREQHD